MIELKISWLKTKNDKESFKVFQNLGFSVYNLEEPENTDEKIKELIENNCKTIVLSNEIASFSKDIITKYNKQDDISIIIDSGKNTEKD